MDKEMSRREFIKASAAAGLVLAGADILSKSGSTAHAAVQIPEAEKVTITIVTDNLYDVTVPSVKIAKRYLIRSGEPIVNFGLHAEHGLAYHIETVVVSTLGPLDRPTDVRLRSGGSWEILGSTDPGVSLGACRRNALRPV